MKQIPLSKGQFALVDDADFELLNDFKWCYRGERGKAGYAVRHVKLDGKDRLLSLHRQLMNPQEGQEVIFRNHDTLDCRRENLCVVSKQEARQHHRVRRDSRSGAKGVRYSAETNSWSAYVYRHGHAYHVGTYHSKEAAEDAYQRELRRENPDLHTAPKVVERQREPAPVQQGNPDVPAVSEKG